MLQNGRQFYFLFFLLCFKNVFKDILTFGPYVVKCLQPHKKGLLLKTDLGLVSNTRAKRTS